MCQKYGGMKITLQILIVSAGLVLLAACSTPTPQNTSNGDQNWKGYPRGPSPNSNTTMKSSF